MQLIDSLFLLNLLPLPFQISYFSGLSEGSEGSTDCSCPVTASKRVKQTGVHAAVQCPIRNSELGLAAETLHCRSYSSFFKLISAWSCNSSKVSFDVN